MNQFVIVRIKSGAQQRILFEIPRDGGGGAVEGRYQNSAAINDYNSAQDPAAFYFANTEKEAKSLAFALAFWNPGSTWQWFKVAGVAETKRPGDTPSIKEITEKGFLPKDIV